MNSTQIDHLLNLIEEKSTANSSEAWHEAAVYIQNHMDEVADELQTRGMVSIPTKFGEVNLSSADLGMAAAA